MKKRHAFTLIELLVVLAILGLIFGLVIPGVQQVRCSARMTACLSNIRQLGMACVMYEQDYDALPGSLSKLRPYKKSMYAENYSPFTIHHSLNHLLAIKSAHAQYPHLPPYYQHEESILICPESPELGTQGYALNEKVVGKKLVEVNNARCILMGDYAGGSSTLLIESIDHLGFRHCRESRANVFFANMTTESLTTDEATQNNLEPEEDPDIWWGIDGYFTRGEPTGNPGIMISIDKVIPSHRNEKDELISPDPELAHTSRFEVRILTTDPDTGQPFEEVVAEWSWIAILSPPPDEPPQ